MKGDGTIETVPESYIAQGALVLMDNENRDFQVMKNAVKVSRDLKKYGYIVTGWPIYK
jgi:hypothetical protein